MGTWGPGPFDSDDALDLADELDELPEHNRAAAIRHALTTPGSTTGPWVYAEVAVRAVAAAELVARQVTGATAEFGPEKPIPVLPPEFRDLALAALDRVTAGDSELAVSWNHSGNAGQWLAELDRLRTELTTGLPGGPTATTTTTTGARR